MYELYEILFLRQYYQIHQRSYHLSSKQNEKNERYGDDKDEDDEEEEEDGDDDDFDKIENELDSISTNIVDVTSAKLIKLNENSNYPIDLITFNSNFCATSDLNNQIKIWNLLSNKCVNVVTQQNKNQIQKDEIIVSIWSICFIKENILGVGLSNGQLLAYDHDSKYPICVSQYDSIGSTAGGITHIIKLINNEDATANKSFFLISRLNGYLETFLFEFNHPEEQCKLISIKSLQAHLNPITFISYEYDYILTSSAQEQVIKVFKQKNLEYTCSLRQNYLISALTISKFEPKIALSGYTNGFICVWSLLDGACKYKLNDSNNKSIIKLEITENLIISLNRMKKLSIWNLLNGQLLNEFQLKSSFFNTQLTNMFICTDKYLITTNVDHNERKTFIFVWSLDSLNEYDKKSKRSKCNNLFALIKKLCINRRLVDEIKLLGVLKPNNSNDDFVLIHDANNTLYLMELKF